MFTLGGAWLNCVTQVTYRHLFRFFRHEIAPYPNLGLCRVVGFSLDHPMFLSTCLQRGAARYNEKLAVLTYVTKNGFLYFWLPKIFYMQLSHHNNNVNLRSTRGHVGVSQLVLCLRVAQVVFLFFFFFSKGLKGWAHTHRWA